MPEGDTIYGAARRIRAALVGKQIASIETPHRRFERDRWPERLLVRSTMAMVIGNLNHRGGGLLGLR